MAKGIGMGLGMGIGRAMGMGNGCREEKHPLNAFLSHAESWHSHGHRDTFIAYAAQWTKEVKGIQILKENMDI